MKPITLLFILLFTAILSGQNIVFADADLKNKLLQASPDYNIARNEWGELVAVDTNNDNEISQSEALEIYELRMTGSSISDLSGLEYFTNLVLLDLYQNDIVTFDGSTFVNLEDLDLSVNDITTADFTGMSALQILRLSTNPIGSVDLTSSPALELLQLNYCNALNSVDVSGLANLETLSLTSASSLDTLLVAGCTSLTSINCAFSSLDSLDITGLTSLESLTANGNGMQSLTVGGNTSLISLSVYNNNIQTLNVTDMPVLNSLNASENDLSSFQISETPLLATLVLNDNQLTETDLSQVPSVTILHLQNNLLTEFITAPLNMISTLDLSGNQFTEIDLTNCGELYQFQVNNNPNLEALLVKNGTAESLDNSFSMQTPQLRYICVDLFEVNDYRDWVTMHGYSNVNINTYCTFVPTGEYYEIQGSTRFDSQGDGCSTDDPLVPYMKYGITNNTDFGVGITDDTGFFNFPVQAGQHTFGMVPPNIFLFTVAPPSATVNFPATPSPFVQDFCMTASSVHNDIEALILPLETARPGYPASYILTVYNIGNQVMNGQAILTIPENTVTFTSSDVPYDQLNGTTYTWNYSDLFPYETFTVILHLEINAPTHPEFPVNIGDILSFNIQATPVAGDFSPENNEFTLNHPVVNSYDPNDIVCMQGESLPLDQVGEYVHYRIRFENLGNFPAENIVIKNMINTAQFDLNSFMVVDGSHPFETRITGNKIEFIFEGVNLPFEDGSNDGYIIYRIKTQPTLQLGDVFSNSAEIYFDYNFPVETGEYVTEIEETMGVAEVRVSAAQLYPNPVKDMLQVRSDQEMKSVEVYDMQGRKLLQKEVARKKVDLDLEHLNTGKYILQIQYADGKESKGFLKK